MAFFKIERKEHQKKFDQLQKFDQLPTQEKYKIIEESRLEKYKHEKHQTATQEVEHFAECRKKLF